MSVRLLWFVVGLIDLISLLGDGRRQFTDNHSFKRPRQHVGHMVGSAAPGGAFVVNQLDWLGTDLGTEILIGLGAVQLSSLP